MVILGWNYQGVGRPLTIRALRELNKRYHPSVIFLMETKNKREALESSRRKLRMNFSDYCDPVGQSGGLSL